MHRIAIYTVHYQDGYYLRLLDGVYSRIPDGFMAVDYLTYPGEPCDQNWAVSVHKANMCYSPAMVKLFFGLDPDIYIYGGDIYDDHSTPLSEFPPYTPDKLAPANEV